MKRLLFTTTLVLILLGASLSPSASLAESSRLRKRVTSVCSALLATTAVSLSAMYANTDQMPNPGFGARLWVSDRRAVVTFLARALGIRDTDEDIEKMTELTVESRGIERKLFDGINYEQLQHSTIIARAEPGITNGYIFIKNSLIFFNIFDAGNGSIRVVFSSSPQ
jgi:hypothetical protein